MIVEGLLTTMVSGGTVNVAPMGPVIHGDFESLLLRPFRGSTTFENLMQSRCGVFHVVDRVNIIAEAAIRRLGQQPASHAARQINGLVLNECCRWFELQVTDIDDSDERVAMSAEIIHAEERRPFFGFNRARHAVIEAAILATRLHLLPRKDVEVQMQPLSSAVRKTGGPEEQDAFDMLSDYVRDFYAGALSR